MLILMRRPGEEILVGHNNCINTCSIDSKIVTVTVNDEQPISYTLEQSFKCGPADFKIIKVQGNQVHYGITAPREIDITRLEVAHKEILDAHGRS